jgi:DNA-binding HxlR family transcriptional regulator
MSTRYSLAAVEHLARRHFLASRKGAGDATPFEQIRQQNIFEVLEYLSWKHVWDGHDEPFEVLGLLPVRVYLPEEDRQTEDSVARAINSIAAAFELDIAFEFREVRGSWLKTWFMNVRDALSSRAVAERLQKLERAVQLRGADLPQAQAHAVQSLLSALDLTPSAFVQVGLLLIVKQPEAGIRSRTMTPDDLARLELNPSLISTGGVGGQLPAFS